MKLSFMQSLIFHTCVVFRIVGGMEPIPAAIGQEAGQTSHCSVPGPKQRQTPMFDSESLTNLTYGFGLWVEAGVSGENSHR